MPREFLIPVLNIIQQVPLAVNKVVNPPGMISLVPRSIVSVRHLGVKSVEFGLFLINVAHRTQDGLVTNKLII